ncbi:hypothetical protein [Clostridium estertheticum]|uniref:hypothetical protein n=1 Tax=Clostridium estertheticum TaxID=238834 RepID=UPI001CF47F01|nr:hypothetical protein [Clostridium estertheticum]MCB2359433.1 hypothetical protein [Clostridium estertheticum]
MKDYLRDYTTAAFRFYAQNDKSAEKYKKKVYIQALEDGMIREGNKSGISKPTETAIIAAEGAVSLKIAEINDMEAVEKVIAELDVKRRRDIIQAIEYVYFSNPQKDIEDIKAKVHIAEIYIPASERSIYRWLRQARDLFAVERGLRVN